MRAFIFTLVAGLSLGLIGLVPTDAKAWWYGRGPVVSSYYCPPTNYYPQTYYYAPPTAYYYSPPVSSYYYSPPVSSYYSPWRSGYSYGSYYYTPSYYGPVYSGPVWRSRVYFP